MSTTKTSINPVPTKNQNHEGGGRGRATSSGGGGGVNKKKVNGSICGGFRLPAKTSKRFQPAVKFMRRLGKKMAKGMRIISMRKQRDSRKVSSASLIRSRSCADPIHDDTHRAEAIEDCIEFLNSSSSLRRSNSVSSISK